MGKFMHALCPKGEKIICAVGSGGKSSLLIAMCNELDSEGSKAIMMTTTKLAANEPRARCMLIDPKPNQIEPALKEHGWIIMGGSYSEEKISAPSFEAVQAALNKKIHVLIEADGSNRLPLKAAGICEPEVPAFSQRVIIVSGYGIGKRLFEACHRPSLAAERLGINQNDIINEKISLDLLMGYIGNNRLRGFPLSIFLNQADDFERNEACKRIAVQIKNNCECISAVGSLQHGYIEVL